MDFGALPPEIDSGRMYLGPGPANLLAAAAGWESLAAELTGGASSYQTVITTLTDESWSGPASMSMAAAVMPYIAWMTATAEQCAQAATQATAAATPFEAAYAMTVPPPLVAANRVRLPTLIQTNIFGQNTPAIMAAGRHARLADSTFAGGRIVHRIARRHVKGCKARRLQRKSPWPCSDHTRPRGADFRPESHCLAV